MTWQAFARARIRSRPFIPYTLSFDRGNPTIEAQTGIENYLDFWVNRPGGGADSWAKITMRHNPMVIVELGMALGIRTCIIGKLNPDSLIYGCDILHPHPIGNLPKVSAGYFAVLNNIPIRVSQCRSWELNVPWPVNLVFIDADHSHEAVMRDSEWALKHVDRNNFRIVWDDYSLPSVASAVDEFCNRNGFKLTPEFGYQSIGT